MIELAREVATEKARELFEQTKLDPDALRLPADLVKPRAASRGKGQRTKTYQRNRRGVLASVDQSRRARAKLVAR